MVREVVHDVLFLGQKSEPATQADKQVAIDLLDTLKAHEEGCVGMAANMIGVKKRIIAVNMGFMNVAMFNPRIVKKSGSYQTEEGCLSLIGVRPCTRYQEIELEYQDMNWKKQRQKYTGWIAQIIQHEVDHCNGIIVEFLLFNLRTFYRIMKQNQYSLVILDDARSTTCRISLKMQSRRDVDD